MTLTLGDKSGHIKEIGHSNIESDLGVMVGEDVENGKIKKTIW